MNTETQYNLTGRLIDEYGNIISDMLNYNTYYMDNYIERYYNNNIEFISKYRYLIMLGLKTTEIEELIDLIGGDEIVEEYKAALEDVINDYEIPPYIEGERDREMLIKGSLKEAENIKREAIEQARQQVEQAKQQVKEQSQKEIAIHLLEEKLDVGMISRVTGLSIEDLNKLNN